MTGAPHITTARVAPAAPGPKEDVLVTAREDTPGTATPACRIDGVRWTSALRGPS